ncbi:HYC_CC_PP family protein [Algibacter luteus]|uniref:HYC_CC_PP family protein n=1 Tax=Algibacter luteus TaxID=1178825 RepID=UPI002594BAD2|nr:hypothetical protein [Algibacter luteus]WJJ96427.1 hypothetical protein O5O44_14525 [Algibacter luteus]
MKKSFYKISSFLMALLVMLSTVSFTIESHYCGDFLVDTSLFGSAESCGMDLAQNKCSKEDTLEGTNCCNNEQITVNGQNELNVSIDNLTNDQQIFVATFVYAYINLFEGLENEVSSFSQYPPPFIVKNIYKLDETYLI